MTRNNRDKWKLLGEELSRSEEEFSSLAVGSRSISEARDQLGVVTVTLSSNATMIAIRDDWERIVAPKDLEAAISEALNQAMQRRYEIEEFGLSDVITEQASAAAPPVTSNVSHEFVRRTSELSVIEFNAELDSLIAQVQAHVKKRSHGRGPLGIATINLSPDGHVNSIRLNSERLRGVGAKAIEQDIGYAIQEATESMSRPFDGLE